MEREWAWIATLNIHPPDHNADHYPDTNHDSIYDHHSIHDHHPNHDSDGDHPAHDDDDNYHQHDHYRPHFGLRASDCHNNCDTDSGCWGRLGLEREKTLVERSDALGPRWQN